MSNTIPSLRTTRPTPRPGAVFGVLILAACTLLAACSAAPKSHLRSLDVAAAFDANQNTATALDLVFVYDVAALERLPGAGPQWFEHKAALSGELGNAVDIVTLQIPPGSVLDVALPSRRDQAIAVFSYANYVDKAGHPRGTLTGFGKMRIHLASDRVDYIGEQ